eukprot:12746922-Heterocapsa_arctica.AAC.1
MSLNASSSSMSPPLLLHSSGQGRSRIMVRVPSHVDIVALRLVPKLSLVVRVVGFPLGSFVLQGFQQALVSALGEVHPVQVQDSPIDVEKTSSQVTRSELIIGVRSGHEIPLKEVVTGSRSAPSRLDAKVVSNGVLAVSSGSGDLQPDRLCCMSLCFPEVSGRLQLSKYHVGGEKLPGFQYVSQHLGNGGGRVSLK